MRILMWGLVVLVGLGLIGWLGLKVQPRPFEDAPITEGTINTTPIPAGLPDPVERFMRVTYGDAVPVIQSAVLTGRGRIKPNLPFYMPARFRFTHETGTNYRHYIEATWFGIPILRVDEGIVDGASFFENPILGNVHDEPGTNQGATLALWAEAMWFPSILVTDPRARWEAVDGETALLHVPFEGDTVTFVTRFDPDTGLLTTMESMRARTSDLASKILWITRSERWGNVKGYLMGVEGSATWIDQGLPWAYFTIEDLLYNGDVSSYVRGRGR